MRRTFLTLAVIFLSFGAHSASAEGPAVESPAGWASFKHEAGKPFEVAQLLVTGVGAGGFSSYTPPTLTGLFAYAGDSFGATCGGQSYAGGLVYSAGIGACPLVEVYGRSGHRVMPSETYMHGVSGSSPYSMAFRGQSPRTDCGNALSTSGATMTSTGNPVSLTISINSTAACPETGPRIFWPGTVFTLPGSSNTATITTLAGMPLGGTGTLTNVNNGNSITGTAVTLTATKNPAQAVTTAEGATNVNDGIWNVGNTAGGDFVDASANVINFENVHNGIGQAENFPALDQYLRAAGPNGAWIGADGAPGPTLYPTYTWTNWPTATFQAGANAFVSPDDNYLGDVIYNREVITHVTASVSPTVNAGLNISGGVVSSYFSADSAGYPATYNNATGVSTGTAFNPTPVLLYGGTSNEVLTVGTRVTGTPTANQYTLQIGVGNVSVVSGTYVLGTATLVLSSSAGITPGANVTVSGITGTGVSALNGTFTTTTGTTGTTVVYVVGSASGVVTGGAGSVFAGATYGFSAADVTNGTQTFLTYSAAASGYKSGSGLNQYLDYAGYFTSTASNYVGAGTGTNWHVPGASFYPWVHPALTWEASLDPAALLAGFKWPIPVLQGNSGNGNHASFTGVAVYGQAIGAGIATGAASSPAIWNPQPYQSLQIYKGAGGNTSGTAWHDVLPQSVTGNLSVLGAQFCTSGNVCATAGAGTGQQALTGANVTAGCINITAGSSCGGSTLQGAWNIQWTTSQGANTLLYFYGSAINPRPALPANGQGPNLLINPLMAYDACGSGITDTCGGAATAAGGILSGWSNGTGFSCGGQGSGSGVGTLASNVVPQNWTFSGTTGLQTQMTAGLLTIACSYTASDPAGNPAFVVTVNGYFPSVAAFNIGQTVVISSQDYLVPLTDKIRVYARYLIAKGQTTQSDGVTHMIGVNSPALSVGLNTPSGTMYGRPCSSGSLLGANCTSNQASCQPGDASLGGDTLTDYGLIDGGGTYYKEECLSLPVPLYSDAGAGTVSGLAIKLVLPGEANFPVSYTIYIEEFDVHVATK